MNNSKLIIDSVPLRLDVAVVDKPRLRVRETQLSKIVDALRKIQTTREWSTLKTELFDALPETLERQLKSEAQKETPDTLKLNRIAGQLKWAEKYADLSKLEDVFRLELTQVKQQLYGKTEETG